MAEQPVQKKLEEKEKQYQDIDASIKRLDVEIDQRQRSRSQAIVAREQLRGAVAALREVEGLPKTTPEAGPTPEGSENEATEDKKEPTSKDDDDPMPHGRRFA